MSKFHHNRAVNKVCVLIYRVILLIGFCFVLHVSSSIALCAEYYVSPTGRDSNVGTINSPFLTIRMGISKLKSGDILYVRGGTYVESILVDQSGTEDLPITIMAYPGEEPVIDGEDKLPASDGGDLVLVQGNYVHISGFEVKNSNIKGTRLGGGGVMLEGQHTKASRIKVHHTWEHGIIAKGNYSIVEDCVVWQCAYSNSKNPGNPSAGYWSTGISAARSPIDGITKNAILRRNVCFNNWGEGLSSFEAEGTLIEDNISYDNWSVNLYISDTRDALVQRNIVYNTPNNIVGQRRPLTLGDELANKPRSANNIVINNFIYNADLWAFWSTGVPGSGLDNVIIANNTVINGQLEIGASIEDQVQNKSALICNNIFSNDKGPPWEIMGSLASITFSNNLWLSLPPVVLRSLTDIVGDPRIEKTGGTGVGELSGNYFKLTGASPAIDKGIVINVVTEDFFENSRDEKPDIGAHEFQPSTGSDLIENSDEDNAKPRVSVDHSVMTIHLDKSDTYKNMVMYNSVGIPVLARILTGSSYSVDISSLASGIYIISLLAENNQMEIKVLVP